MRAYILVFLTLFFGGTLLAQSSHKLLRSGDNAYEDDNFQAAEELSLIHISEPTRPY